MALATGSSVVNFLLRWSFSASFCFNPHRMYPCLSVFIRG